MKKFKKYFFKFIKNNAGDQLMGYIITLIILVLLAVAIWPSVDKMINSANEAGDKLDAIGAYDDGGVIPAESEMLPPV